MRKYLNLTALAALFLVLSAFIPAKPALIRNLHGDGTLILHNLHLGESLSIQYKKPDGTYDPQAIASINHLLRCRVTHKVHPMSVELIELVDQIQDHFGGKQVQVISGYRSPEFNAQLYKKGRKVAKHSQHMLGHALDIRIEGVTTETLRQYAASLKIGGVGFYRENQFVHVDVGPVRYW